MLPGATHAFGTTFHALQMQAPAVAIGCGRQAALATRLLRARGSRTIQILDPRLDPAHWDLVIAPEHDGLAGANVLTLLGSLNPVDDAWLADARTAFPAFAHLPSPRTAVLDRVLALQSRGAERNATRRFELGALTIDMAALQARWDETPIVLRPNEFRLLRFLAENPNRVLTREDLISGLGKREPPIDERTVDVWIGRLRRAIKSAGGGNPLRTVRSLGYVFDLG